MTPYLDTLIGMKVALRHFTADDITKEYIGWLNDPEVVRYSNQRFFNHTYDTCENYVFSFNNSNNLLLKIINRLNNETIGTMTAYRSIYHSTADIGIMIGNRNTWGKGFGQDAWNTLLSWLLDTAKVRKATGGAMRRNIGMVRIMERSGMVLEAIRPAQELLDGQPEDLVYYGKYRVIK